MLPHYLQNNIPNKLNPNKSSERGCGITEYSPLPWNSWKELWRMTKNIFLVVKFQLRITLQIKWSSKFVNYGAPHLDSVVSTRTGLDTVSLSKAVGRVH